MTRATIEGRVYHFSAKIYYDRRGSLTEKLHIRIQYIVGTPFMAFILFRVILGPWGLFILILILSVSGSYVSSSEEPQKILGATPNLNRTPILNRTPTLNRTPILNRSTRRMPIVGSRSGDKMQTLTCSAPTIKRSTQQFSRGVTVKQ